MRRTSLLFLTLLIGCGKATLDGSDAGGDGDGDCGGSCTPEQACINDLCEDLDDVAVPSYASRWADVTGWTRPGDEAIRATFADVAVAGLVYECRTGHADVFGALPFTPCDGGDGTEPEHIPAPTADQEEGGYRTEVRTAVGAWTSEAVGFDFYVHHSLDGVRDCPPASTDDEIFTAAAARVGFVAAEFPAATEAQAPFVHLPFRNVIRHRNMSAGYPPTFTTGDPFDVELTSLRRRFTLNADRTLLLVQRRYVSRMHLANLGSDSCRNSFRFGVNHYNSTEAPRQFVDCVNFVLNSRGEGVCVDLAQDTPITIYSDIGWAKLIQRREVFSLKGVAADCVETAGHRCWNWYLETPE